MVGKDVVTESGQFIGRVRDFEFDPEDGAIARLIVDAWGVPTVPEGVVSTYAVDVAEILDAEPNASSSPRTPKAESNSSA